MGKRSSKKSLVAILFACVWAMIVLCLSMPVRPAEQAHAASLMDREIFIMATDLDAPGGGSAGETYEWGSFYRGMGVLSEVSYQSDKGKGGTITWDDIDNDSGEVILTISERTDPLYNHGDRHNFTDGATFEPLDENTHWAVCPDCGFKLQVAHRPDDAGTCKDCGEDLGDDYVNSYTFTIPDEISLGDVEWTEGEPPSLSFSVSLDANLYAGVTLKLFLQCENGIFISENSESLGYTVSAADDSDYGTGEAYDASGLTDAPQAIWELTVYEDTKYDGTDDYLRKIIEGLTITVTLEVPEENLQGLTYSGDFFDTLIFSAELTETEEY